MFYFYWISGQTMLVVYQIIYLFLLFLHPFEWSSSQYQPKIHNKSEVYTCTTHVCRKMNRLFDLPEVHAQWHDPMTVKNESTQSEYSLLYVIAKGPFTNTRWGPDAMINHRRVPPPRLLATSDREISADLTGKVRQGKMEQKRRKIEKGKMEKWKWNEDKWDKLQNEEKTFSFFFFFSLFKSTEICFWVNQNGNYLPGKSISHWEKIRKN